VTSTKTRNRTQEKCAGSGLPVSRTRSGSMKCPVCHRVYKITKGGTLWRHVVSSPHWERRDKCHRRHAKTVRCLWCGGTKTR
jgi:hypothetical protein